MVKNQKGFTLIEIIAVLVILGLLAAVAVPRYVDVMQQAKNSAALAEVAEMKAALNLAYAQLFITNGTAPTSAASVVNAFSASVFPLSIGTAPDVWSISMTGAGAVATITVISRGTPVDTDYTATGTWNIPQ